MAATRFRRALLAGAAASTTLLAPPGAAAATAPSSPALLSPAAGATFGATDPQVFTVSAVDPEGLPYSATITVREAATGNVVRVLSTAPTPSGMPASAIAVPPFPPGTYTWSARAVDLGGATSAESVTSSFGVADPATVAGGALDGEFRYWPSRLPHGSCAPTSFAVDAVAVAAVVHLRLVGYVGTLVVSGSGTSPCENVAAGTGTLVLHLSGIGLTSGTLGCTVSGPYARTGALTARLTGSCAANTQAFGTVVVRLALAGAPTEPDGAGVFVPANVVRVTGALTVSSM